MYRFRVHLPLILTLFLAAVVLSPTILPARGVIAYTPGVIGGQWALYKQLYSNCMPPNPALCGSQTSSIDYGLLDVVSVYNTQVTLNLVSVYANGTGTHQGVLVDVATGYSNFTFSPVPQPVPFNFFVVAKNLVASQNLYPLSPSRFNSTISETVAGQDRMVNTLNYTVSSSYQGFSTRISTEFQFDQSTGLFVKLSFSSLTIISYQGYQQTSESDSAFGMVDNNVWSSPGTSYPDFGISIAPTSVSTVQTSHANSTITITRMRGFNATVALSTASSSSSLTCTLSQTRLVKGGTDKSILSCTGSPGSYSVTVTGNSGYTTHPATATINIQTTPPAKAAPSTILDLLQTPAGYGGIAAAGIIIALLALLFTRRKRAAPQPTPGSSNTPVPPTTTGPADAPPSTSPP